MELLSKITPSIVHNILDRWTSTHLSDGKYYPSSAYKWLVTQGNHLPPSIPHVLFKWLWKIRIPKKGKMMFGLILHNSLPTNAPFLRCLLPHCSYNNEDVLHCLRDCPHAKEIWLRLGFANHSNFLINNPKNWIRIHLMSDNGFMFSLLSDCLVGLEMEE
ncbi:putative ribonuclease H protein [Glycine soja]